MQKQDNQQTDLLLRGVAAATLDEAAGEIYIADGYLNKRVMVYDWNTGAFKRGWGAYGKPLSEISNDGQPDVGKDGEPAGKGLQVTRSMRFAFPKTASFMSATAPAIASRSSPNRANS